MKKTVPFLAFFLAVLLFSSCGKQESVPELAFVPKTSLLHVHLDSGAGLPLLFPENDETPAIVLADSLLKSGPLGISLVGIDISTLEPQLIFLSRNATTEYATALAARVLDLDPRQEENRTDLVSSHGFARASVTERDGWTALYTGAAPRITIENWLALNTEDTFAADTFLTRVLPDHPQVTVLFSGNLFAFLSLLPLERQLPWWAEYKRFSGVVKPAALSFWLSWPESGSDEALNLSAGVQLARHDGGISSIDVSISDSKIDTDSCFTLLLQLVEGVDQHD